MKWMHICCLLLGMNGFIQAQPTQNQLLWKISHASLDQDSYLYGTMHVRDRRVFQFSDSVLAKLHEADIFAMEVHPDDMIAFYFQQGSSEETPLISDVLSTFQFLLLKTRYQREFSLDLSGIRVGQLSVLDDLLGDAAPDSLDRPAFLDAHLFELARGWGHKVVGLEDIQDHMKVVETATQETKNELTLEEEVSNYLIWRLDHRHEPSYLEGLRRIYEQGDIEAIESWREESTQADSTGKKTDFDLIRRNYIMADSIAILSRIGKSFSAVGAAHLPGEEGVIELLREKGFSVEVVPATYTGVRDRYENLPRTPRTWQSHDQLASGYSAEFPLEPHSLNMEGGGTSGTSTIMAIDMGRGREYLVVALPADPEEDPKEVYKRLTDHYLSDKGAFVDPEIKYINNLTRFGNPAQALSFSSGKLERNHIRMQLLSGNGMIYILMTSGKQAETPEIAQDTERFFDSFSLNSLDAPGMVLVRDEDLAFQSLVPIGYNNQIRLKQIPDLGDSTDVARIHMFSGATDQGNSFYLAATTLYPSDYFFPNDSLTMAGTVEAARKRVGEQGFLRDTAYYSEDAYIREFIFTSSAGNNQLGWTRYILRGLRMHSQVATFSAGTDPKPLQAFKKSFALLPLKQSQPESWHLYTDSITGLRVSMPNAEVIQNDQRAYSASHASASIWTDYEMIDNTAFTSMDSSSSITFDLTIDTHSDFVEYDDPDSVMHRIISNYETTYSESGFQFFDTTHLVVDGLPAHEVIGKYKHSLLNTRVRFVWKGKTLISQIVTAPAKLMTSKPIEHFFNSLDISDLQDSSDLYSPKHAVILQGLYSPDTLQRSFARRALNQTEFSETHIPQLLTALQEMYPEDSSFINQPHTLSMIGDKLAGLDATEMIPIIKERYADFEKHPALQAEWIEDLGILNTQASFEAMAALLYSPPSKTGYLVTRGMNASFDSGYSKFILPVATHMLQNETWENEVISFHLRAADSGLVSLDTLQLFSDAIQRQAKVQIDSLTLLSGLPDSLASAFNVYDNYSLILALGYLQKTDSLLQAIRDFERLLQEEESLLFASASSLIRLGEDPLPESMDLLTNSLYWQMDIIELAEKWNRLDILPEQFRSQSTMARSIAVNTLDQGIPDKVEILNKRKITVNGQEGWVYAVSIKWEDYDGGELVFAGLFDLDTNLLTPISQISDYYYMENAQDFEKIDEHWEEFVEELEP